MYSVTQNKLNSAHLVLYFLAKQKQQVSTQKLQLHMAIGVGHADFIDMNE